MSISLAPPPHKTHRQWAICHGALTDHAGEVQLSPIADFDLDRTIFGTLQGALTRKITARRIGQHQSWDPSYKAQIARSFEALRQKNPPPRIDPKLTSFLRERCDFSSEHADGSFWEHLYFGYEYSLHHDPKHSARVMLLHSILGTGTNTFAMRSEHLDELQSLLTDFEWRHIQAFPSLLRLLYHGSLLDALAAYSGRALPGIRCHRVIDNQPITLSSEDLIIGLNYQLMHLMDFVPIANWFTHRNNPSFLLFVQLHAFLKDRGKILAKVGFDPHIPQRRPRGETRPWLGRWMDHIPARLITATRGRAIETFSAKIGHNLHFDLI